MHNKIKTKFLAEIQFVYKSVIVQVNFFRLVEMCLGFGFDRQQSGIQGIPAPYSDHRSFGRGSQSQRHGRGSGGSRRYQPYQQQYFAGVTHNGFILNTQKHTTFSSCSFPSCRFVVFNQSFRYNDNCTFYLDIVALKAQLCLYSCYYIKIEWCS